DLFDFYISQNNTEILNMLNVKYFIFPTEESPQAQQNPEAFGNAWFVNNVKWAESADEEILSLGEVDLSNTAVINAELQDKIPDSFPEDPSASIELISYAPNELKYRTSASSDQLAVFSEIYYPHGWKTFIDGEESNHFQANYTLRAMVVPAGEHEISFKFAPEVVKKGSNIALTSSILLGILLLGGIFYTFK